MTDKIYNLDQAATTRTYSWIADKVKEYLCDKYYNPSARYKGADEVRTDIENARRYIANVFEVSPEEIIFTSGGSESNCLAIRGVLDKYPDDSMLISTSIEHKSIMEFAKYYPDNSVFVPVNSDGFVSHQLREEILSSPKKNIIVSVQAANNEIGVCQHIEKIYEMISEVRKDHPEKTILFHTDATQFIGHVEIEEFRDLLECVDMCTFSGHKIGAPKGIGILIKKKHVKLKPLIFGTQEHGLRGGTENVAGIIAMRYAVEALTYNDWVFSRSCYKTRNAFVDGITQITPVKVNGWNRLSNIISLTFEDERINGEVLVEMLNLLGVYVSLGSACSQRLSGTSHVLKAIGLSERETMRTIRISFTNPLSKEEIDEIVSRFKTAIDKIISIAESSKGEE